MNYIILGLIVAIFVVVLLARWWAITLNAIRAERIRRYTLPPGLFAKLQARRPEVSLKDCQLVGHALRQFFLSYLKGGYEQVAMPSQIVDDLWHEFILYTREYARFCSRSFGHFLHHAPAAVLKSSRNNNEALRRCWWYACLEENINPRRPTRLPLLFALDRKLNIADGFVYATDCSRPEIRETYASGTGVVHCAADFGDVTIDGSIVGFGPPARVRSRDDKDSSCNAGCSTASNYGCSGGGCSGGCSGGCGGH